jgi:RND superfamily putative drug exporter
VAETLTREFAVDGSETITMVAHGGPSAARAAAGLAHRAQLTAGAQASVAPPRYLGRNTWEIELLPRGTDGSTANQRLLARLRALPGEAAGVPGAGGISRAGSASGASSAFGVGSSSGASGVSRPLVGGSTAWFVDQKAAISAHTPLTLAILALVTGGFLFLMTGSLLLPFVALAMNLLTVAVGAGLLVLVFQDGHLSSLLGFSPIGGLEESNLVLLFVVAFALSTDYGVFLFGRIKEAHDDGLPTREAVARGLERTGRLVTAAALLFCVAIGAFVSSHVFFVKQLGFGAALAVAIDATLVRALLVPALMGWLGEATWWAPRPLRGRRVARVGRACPAGVE